MTENDFSDILVERLSPDIHEYKIGTRKSVLYDMAINDQGRVEMGVDLNSGEPIRGGGKGFQQDILVYKEVEDGHTSVVPKLIVEVKLNRVTTHDAIVYSEKARRIRRIYPYVRYGLLLGGMEVIPGRVLRLGEAFDFIHTVGNPPGNDELRKLHDLLVDEVKVSENLTAVLFRRKKVSSLRRRLELEEGGK